MGIDSRGRRARSVMIVQQGFEILFSDQWCHKSGSLDNRLWNGVLWAGSLLQSASEHSTYSEENKIGTMEELNCSAVASHASLRFPHREMWRWHGLSVVLHLDKGAGLLYSHINQLLLVGCPWKGIVAFCAGKFLEGDTTDSSFDAFSYWISSSFLKGNLGGVTQCPCGSHWWI